MAGLVKALVTGQSLVLADAVPVEDVAITAEAAASTAPDAAEFLAVVTDLGTVATAFNALLAELRGNGMIAPEAEE